MPRSIPNVVANKPNVPISGACVIGAYPDAIQLELPGRSDAVTMAVDSFVEVVKAVGIEPGGVLPCKLIWIVIAGGYHKLVRVKSAAYWAAVRKDMIRGHRPIKKGKLKVGGVYQSLGMQGIYLGHVSRKPAHMFSGLVTVADISYSGMLWCVWHRQDHIPALKKVHTLREQFEILDDYGPIFSKLDSFELGPGYCLIVKTSHAFRVMQTRIELDVEQAVAMINRWTIDKLKDVVDTSAIFELVHTLVISAKGEPKVPEKLRQALKLHDFNYVGTDLPKGEFPELLVHTNLVVREKARAVFKQLKWREASS